MAWRGLWRCPASVPRYEKSGRLLRQIQKMTLQQLRLGLIRNSQNELRMASHQLKMIEDPDNAAFRKSCLSPEFNNYNLFASAQGAEKSSYDDLDLFRSTACNSRPGSTSILQSD